MCGPSSQSTTKAGCSKDGKADSEAVASVGGDDYRAVRRGDERENSVGKPCSHPNKMTFGRTGTALHLLSTNLQLKVAVAKLDQRPEDCWDRAFIHLVTQTKQVADQHVCEDKIPQSALMTILNDPRALPVVKMIQYLTRLSGDGKGTVPKSQLNELLGTAKDKLAENIDRAMEQHTARTRVALASEYLDHHLPEYVRSDIALVSSSEDSAWQDVYATLEEQHLAIYNIPSRRPTAVHPTQAVSSGGNKLPSKSSVSANEAAEQNKPTIAQTSETTQSRGSNAVGNETNVTATKTATDGNVTKQPALLPTPNRKRGMRDSETSIQETPPIRKPAKTPLPFKTSPSPTTTTPPGRDTVTILPGFYKKRSLDRFPIPPPIDKKHFHGNQEETNNGEENTSEKAATNAAFAWNNNAPPATSQQPKGQQADFFKGWSTSGERRPYPRFARPPGAGECRYPMSNLLAAEATQESCSRRALRATTNRRNVKRTQSQRQNSSQTLVTCSPHQAR